MISKMGFVAGRWTFGPRKRHVSIKYVCPLIDPDKFTGERYLLATVDADVSAFDICHGP